MAKALFVLGLIGLAWFAFTFIVANLNDRRRG